MKFSRAAGLSGTITVPGDKSISHRSVMLGSIARGVTEIHGFLPGADCLSTISCFRKMGIHIEQQQDHVKVYGSGLHGLRKPEEVLDCGNSGTTLRLLSGILVAQPFDSILTGDASIQKRPMKRIITPLTAMGADIRSLSCNHCAPLAISGRKLKGISYQSPVASAQVKSAVLLAGLYADGKTSVTEPFLSRNHTELMLKGFGADVISEGITAVISPADELFAQQITIPGDISSAAYFIAAGLITPHSEILIENVGINPTRAGILTVCRQMGADITICKERTAGGEPVADILVKTSQLKGITIGGSIIPTLIDELPIIALMACFAEGTTLIQDAAELKIKESNRIAVMTENLTKMGAKVTATEDGMIIEGGTPLKGAIIDSHLDHRIAMTFAIAGINAAKETQVLGSQCVNISYPGFYEELHRLNQSSI